MIAILIIIAALAILAVYTYTFFADAPSEPPKPKKQVAVPDGYRGFTMEDVDENPEVMPPLPGTFGTGPRLSEPTTIITSTTVTRKTFHAEYIEELQTKHGYTYGPSNYLYGPNKRPKPGSGTNRR